MRKDRREHLKETNQSRRERNLLHSSISPLLPLLRRTAYSPLPVDTLKSSSSASFTGAHAITLDLPGLAILTRLGDAAAGDIVRGHTRNRSVGELLTLLVLVVVVVLMLWVLLVIVVLVLEVVWHRHGDRIREGVWDRDGSGGDEWAVELNDPKIRHHTRGVRQETYLRNIQLIRRLLSGQGRQHPHLLLPNHLRLPKFFAKPLELRHPRMSGDERYRGVLSRNVNRNKSREHRRRGGDPHLDADFV